MPTSTPSVFAAITSSDVVLIGTTLCLAIVALITPIVAEVVKRKFHSAKLIIDFLHSPPYCHQTRMGRNIPAYYFRFKVTNEGKIQADRCEAVLEKVWKEDNRGKFIEWSDFSPMPLKWSGTEKDQYFTIQPERTVFVDIGRIYDPNHQIESAYFAITEEQKALNKFFFELATGRPYAQWDCLVPGKYKIKISIYSNNAKKVTREFEIVWSGKWVEGPAMLNELAIS